MNTKFVFCVSLAALTILAGSASAQHGAAGRGGQGAGRGSAGAGNSAGRSADSPAFVQDDELRQSRAQQAQQEKVQQQQAVKNQSAETSLAERIQQQTELRRELGLSGDQEAALLKIREREQSEIRAISDRRLMTKARKEKQIRSTVEKNSAEVRGLLTPDQVRKLDQVQARDRDRERDQVPDQDRLRDRDQDKTRSKQTPGG